MTSRTVAGVSAGIALLSGCTVLAGWQCNVQALKSILPGIVNMNPVTAVGFLLLGSSLLLQLPPGNVRARTAGRILACGVIALGALRIWTYAGGPDLGQDAWVFHAKVMLVPNRNAIAPNTASCQVLMGSALLLLDWRPRGVRPSQSLALLAITVASLTVLGYLFGVKEFYGVLRLFPMALHTGLNFVAVGIGIVAARPDTGVMRVLAADDHGGRVARRLLPLAAGVPILLGWLRLLGEQRGYYPAAFGIALMVVGTAVTLVVMVLAVARSVSLAEGRARASAAALQESRRRLEEAERLRQTERFLTDFINNAAHQLATPLTPALLQLRVLRHQDLPPAARGHLDLLERNLERLRSVADGIQQASHLQGRRLLVDAADVDIGPLVTQAVASVSGRAQTLGIAVTALAPPSRAFADAARVVEVLGILLDNALKFTASGGTVTALCKPAGAGVRVEVRDTGKGLDESQVAALWKPFPKHGLVEPQSGIGLGLYVAGRLVDLQGGTFGVRSDGVGKGSTFWFQLGPPKGTGDNPPATPGETAPPPQKDALDTFS